MRTRSRVVRGGVWVMVWLLVGCDSGSSPGGIVATVLRDSPPVAAAGFQVSLAELSQASITNVSGKAAFPNVPAGTYHVTARFIGYCVATAVATVTAGATTFVTLSLGPTPCGGSGSGGTDKIATTGTDPLVGLVDIRTGAAGDPAPCENDRLVEGSSGTADIGVNALTLTDPTVPCHGAAWIFTMDHAPWFDNTASTFPWTDSGGDVVTVTLPANRLRVPVKVWMSGTFNKVAYAAAITTDLAKANGFLREHRTGLLLAKSLTSDATPDIVDVDALGGGLSSIIGSGCGKTSAILNSPLIYQPAQMNIYVVDAVDGASGVNCVRAGAPNVIFMVSTADYVTLLHEIGHGLGLLRPHWGHSQAIAGLYPDNVMAAGASIAGHVSLGQIVRMHADTRSWLNQSIGAGTVRSSQLGGVPLVTACSCPGDTATEDCPGVATDVPRSGSPNPGNPNPACHVTTDVSCVALTPGGFVPGSSATITAQGWTDALATTMGFGEGTSAVLDPSLATVTGSAESPGVLKIDVKAGTATGNTTLLISLGGTFATVTVKVGSPCP